jgi:hypothetical protein
VAAAPPYLSLARSLPLEKGSKQSDSDFEDFCRTRLPHAQIVVDHDRLLAVVPDPDASSMLTTRHVWELEELAWELAVDANTDRDLYTTALDHHNAVLWTYLPLGSKLVGYPWWMVRHRLCSPYRRADASGAFLADGERDADSDELLEFDVALPCQHLQFADLDAGFVGELLKREPEPGESAELRTAISADYRATRAQAIVALCEVASDQASDVRAILAELRPADYEFFSRPPLRSVVEPTNTVLAQLADLLELALARYVPAALVLRDAPRDATSWPAQASAVQFHQFVLQSVVKLLKVNLFELTHCQNGSLDQGLRVRLRSLLMRMLAPLIDVDAQVGPLLVTFSFDDVLEMLLCSTQGLRWAWARAATTRCCLSTRASSTAPRLTARVLRDKWRRCPTPAARCWRRSTSPSTCCA